MRIRVGRIQPMMLVALSAALTLGACKSNETGPDEHTPTSAKLFNASGTELTPSVVLPKGQTTRVEIRFYDAAGAQMTDIETEHYALLTFTPTSLATAVAVSGKHFSFDVTTAASAATGTVTIQFGHDALADEKSFTPVPFTVQ